MTAAAPTSQSAAATAAGPAAGRRIRHQAILRILGRRAIGTQRELVEALAQAGVSTTQATVSRDLRQLGVARVPGGDGPRYALRGAPAGSAIDPLGRALRDFAVGAAPGEALLAVSTLSGCANALAVAIDDAALDGVVATVAGDDSILVLCRDADARAVLAARLGLPTGPTAAGSPSRGSGARSDPTPA